MARRRSVPGLGPAPAQAANSTPLRWARAPRPTLLMLPPSDRGATPPGATARQWAHRARPVAATALRQGCPQLRAATVQWRLAAEMAPRTWARAPRALAQSRSAEIPARVGPMRWLWVAGQRRRR